MTAQEFIAKWSKVDLTERAAAQQHFLDLCELVGHPKPAAADLTGVTFTFEKGAANIGLRARPSRFNSIAAATTVEVLNR
jgi:hypothetical protein